MRKAITCSIKEEICQRKKIKESKRKDGVMPAFINSAKQSNLTNYNSICLLFISQDISIRGITQGHLL